MRTHAYRLIARACPQPAVAVTTGMLSIPALWGAYAPYHVAGVEQTALGSLTTLLLTLTLLAGVVLASRFPIHLSHHLKIAMTSVPLYLMVVLLPVPVAATVAGLGMLLGELSMQSMKKNYPSDIATTALRWTLIALLGALVAHAPLLAQSGLTDLPLVASAAVLWAGDVLTAPLVHGPMCGERPLHLLGPIVREGGLAEAAQYLLGLLGALAATQSLWALILLTLPTGLVYVSFKSAKEMHDSTRLLLESMADTVDLRDPYTGGHSRRVTEYCAAILKEMSLVGPEVDLIISAARVHDIGKIAIPDAVLNKPDKLDPEERALMETHPERGAEVLRRYKDFSRGVAIVLHHHESWDGTGYPHRLAGTAIPFGARLIAVADSFDAMTSDRPYRAGMSVAKAAGILRQNRGIQWDPEVVDAFLRSIADQLERPAPALHLLRAPDTAPATVTA